MTQEDKELLLRDLCARLPYGVKVQIIKNNQLGTYTLYPSDIDSFKHNFQDIKPYLRPMSSMTEEEKKELRLLKDSFDFNCYTAGHYNFQVNLAVADWLLKNHFDYRGLIPMGLAIEVTAENNPYKK